MFIQQNADIGVELKVASTTNGETFLDLFLSPVYEARRGTCLVLRVSEFAVLKKYLLTLIKILKTAFHGVKISKFSEGGCPQSPLATLAVSSLCQTSTVLVSNIDGAHLVTILCMFHTCLYNLNGVFQSWRLYDTTHAVAYKLERGTKHAARFISDFCSFQ